MLGDSFLSNLFVDEMDQLAAPETTVAIVAEKKKRISSRNWHGDIIITFRWTLKNKQLSKLFLYFRP